MIKRKEDLHNTFIRLGNDELTKLYLFTLKRLGIDCTKVINHDRGYLVVTGDTFVVHTSADPDVDNYRKLDVEDLALFPSLMVAEDARVSLGPFKSDDILIVSNGPIYCLATPLENGIYKDVLDGKELPFAYWFRMTPSYEAPEPKISVTGTHENDGDYEVVKSPDAPVPPIQHSHCAVITALASNTCLAVLCRKKGNEEWIHNIDVLFPGFHPDDEYFLCLPDRVNECLHWLNGGEVQRHKIGHYALPDGAKEGETCKAVESWETAPSCTDVGWHPGGYWTDESYKLRIKPEIELTQDHCYLVKSKETGCTYVGFYDFDRSRFSFCTGIGDYVDESDVTVIGEMGLKKND